MKPFGTYYMKLSGEIMRDPAYTNSTPALQRHASTAEPADLSHPTPCSECYAFVGHMEDCPQHECLTCKMPRNGFDHQFNGCPAERPLSFYVNNPFLEDTQPLRTLSELAVSRAANVEATVPELSSLTGFQRADAPCPPRLVNFFAKRFAKTRNVSTIHECDNTTLQNGLLYLRDLLQRSFAERMQLLAEYDKLLSESAQGLLSPPPEGASRALSTVWMGLEAKIWCLAQNLLSDVDRDEAVRVLLAGISARDDIDQFNLGIRVYIGTLQQPPAEASMSAGPDTGQEQGRMDPEIKQEYDVRPETKAQGGKESGHPNRSGSRKSRESQRRKRTASRHLRRT